MSLDTPSTPLVELDKISLSFNQQPVLQEISFKLLPATITTLIGPNGAGKTTLVRVVLGLQNIDAGTLTRRSGLRIGYMPQKLAIDPTFPLTVERFLKTAARVPQSQLRQALKDVSAEHLLQQSIHQLSGGEMQRVLLARALLRKPELLVLDEPVQGVDINGQIALYELIATLRERYHCAVLMISHDLHLVMSATDQVICMNRHICCSGHPELVTNDPAYREMFGERAAQHLALYNHHHNHQHSLHGEIVKDTGCGHSCGDHHA